jgi:hypothetical protein
MAILDGILRRHDLRAWMRAIQGLTTRDQTSLPNFALDSPVGLT